MAERTMVEDLPAHVAGLRRYALALTGSRFEAEDLVQETLTRAIAAAPGFRKGGNLRGWLFTIMHNAFVSGVGERLACVEEQVVRLLESREQRDSAAFAGRANALLPRDRPRVLRETLGVHDSE